MGEIAKILVVDDDESIRKTLKAVLEDEGYIVDTAENGQEAITKSETQFFNLALIDIRLPDMEGTNLLTAFNQTTPRMVKIIVTGYPKLDNAVGALNKGADAYILKPFNVPNMLEQIRKHLKKQEEAENYSEGKVTEFIETRAKIWEEESASKHKES